MEDRLDLERIARLETRAQKSSDKLDALEDSRTQKQLEPTWDTATRGSGLYVKLEEKVEKRVTLVNWKLQNLEKFGKTKTCLVADVTEEDGTKCDPVKLFESSSTRLNKELRPFFEGKEEGEIKLAITAVGSGYDTQYIVKGI